MVNAKIFYLSVFQFCLKEKEMKSVNKAKLLEQLAQRVEGHLMEAIRTFQNCEAEVLLRPSASQGWSIAQCLEHLNSYGRYYLPLIEAGLVAQSKEVYQEEYKSTWLGAYFVQLMEPKKGMAHFKAFKAHVPPVELEPYQVVAEFIDQQEALLTYLEEAKTKDLSAIRIPISILKWLRLPLGDVFQFLVAHDERHVVQAKRNLW